MQSPWLRSNFAVLDKYDYSVFTDDFARIKTVPAYRNGGAVILNTKVLKDRGIAEPTSYADLLKPEFRNLVSMPNPKSSGTGYMFLQNFATIWGDDKAFEYFEKLTKNILQYTSSGSGPVKALVQGEVAVGLGMTPQAVLEINKGTPLKIVFFQEGSPYTIYGVNVIKGKEKRRAVMDVMDFFYSHIARENNEKFCPERIFKDKTVVLPNFPTDIHYANMGDDSIARKQRLLADWDF